MGAKAPIAISTYCRHSTATVLQIPLNDDEEPYVIQDIEIGDITEITKDDILTSNPTSTPTNDIASTFPHIPWLKHDTKITLYINNKMNEPKQGILTQSDGEWYFHQGRTKKKQPLHLPNFLQLAQSLLDNKNMFKGWVSKHIDT